MNFEHYKNFVTVADMRNITAAADFLHIAQSALSNQIKSFEQELGTKLLIRGSRHVELTDAGRVFYRAAKNMIRIDEAAKKEIHDYSTGRRGTLKLGLTPSLPDAWLETLMQDFSAANPLVSYEIFEANTNNLLEYLKMGVVEVAIIRTPHYVPPYLDIVHTADEQFYAFSTLSSEFLPFDKREMSLVELQGIPLSIPRGFRNLITESCQANNFEPLLYSVSSSRSATLLWARLSQAVAVLSCSPSALSAETDLMHIPIQDENLSAQRSIAVLRGTRLSSVCEAFLNFTQDPT